MLLHCATIRITPGGIGLGLLPFVTFCLAAALAATYQKNEPGRLRSSLLIAATAWGVWVVVGCEFLSLFRAVSFWPILLWWILPTLGLTAVVWRRRAQLQDLLRIPASREWGHWPPLLLTSFLILLAGIVAALSSPNTVDALIYHMPRQVRWLQKGSVEHFAIHEVNMLVLPPMAEFAGLHLMVLSGGDFYATLVQWFAFLLAALAASLIVRELGGKALAQCMAMLLVVTNPMAWMQASSAKNDVVAALWVLILTYWVTIVLRRGRCTIMHAVLIGCAAGLAVLTKPTAGIYTLPLLLLLAVFLLTREKIRCLPAGLAIVAIVLSLNAGHSARNLRMFDSPTASHAIRYKDRPLTNEAHTLPVLASNVSRNIGLHIGTPQESLNRRIELAFARFHHWIGIDLNDDRTTIYYDFAVQYHARYEDSAAAPVHIGLFLLALAALPLAVRRPAPTTPGALTYKIMPADGLRIAALAAATIAAFLLFCLIIKWQPWHARLHIGILALAAPVTAVVLCRGAGGRGIGASVTAALLCIVLLPSILWNESRPLVGAGNIWTTPRDAMVNRYHTAASKREVVELVRQSGAAVVGINLHLDGEYALMRQLLAVENPPLLSQPMAPTGRRMARPWPSPNLSISDVHSMPRYSDSSTGTVLHLVHQIGEFRIYSPDEMTQLLRERGLIPAASPSRVPPPVPDLPPVEQDVSDGKAPLARSPFPDGAPQDPGVV